jgi:ribose transport system substrate-binding protein
MNKAIVVAVAMGCLASCSKSGPDSSAAGAAAHKTVRLSLILGATGTEFAGEQRAGAMAAARDLGAGLQLRIAGPAQIDPGEEVKIFQNEIATSPDAIIVAPVPPSLFAEPARRAVEQGNSISYVMTPPSKEIANALYIGQREFEVGRRVANLIADHIIAKKRGIRPEEITGKIITGNCVPGMENLEDRMRGVHSAFKDRLPKVSVPANLNSVNERGSTFSIWQQAVQANPDALAFIGACENDSVSLAKIKEDDHRDFEMVVFDTPEAVRNSIARGTIAAAVPPSHFASTYLAVWLVGTALLKGTPVPQGWLATPIRTIDAANVADFSAASLPPQNLEKFYQGDVDTLKATDFQHLPPLSAARAGDVL